MFLNFWGLNTGTIGKKFQFDDSLRQRSDAQIFIRPSYTTRRLYERKKIDELIADCHCRELPI
jgi:hypothetical protein